MNHSQSMRNVHPPLQRSTSLWSRIRSWITDDAIWQPVYRGMVCLVTWFCGPVFLAVGLVLILGGS